MPPSIEHRETEALAAMMGADSRRIDDLVGSVGEVRGEVTHLRGDMGHVRKGVDELKDALTVLSRHAVLMERQAEDISEIRGAVEKLDTRLQAVEVEMPALKETRTYTVRGVTAVVGVVGAALLALVIRKG